MTTGQIDYRDGNVTLESDGNPFVVDIFYQGRIEAVSQLPSGFMIVEKKNRIFILRISDTQFPNLLFTYNGYFKIKQVSLYSETSKINADVSTLIHTPEKIEDNYSQLNSKWGEYSDSYFYGEQAPSKKTDIVTNNLKTTSGNLTFRDGTKYYGDVHFHSEGYFMTGATHNEDSVRLYEVNKKTIVKKKIIRAKQIGRK